MTTRAIVSMMLLVSTVATTGCVYRPNAGGGYDEPGVHPHQKFGVLIPPQDISSDGRVAAVQMGLVLITAATGDLRPGVGNAPAPHVPGRTGVVGGSNKRHPNAFLPTPTE